MQNDPQGKNNKTEFELSFLNKIETIQIGVNDEKDDLDIETIEKFRHDDELHAYLLKVAYDQNIKDNFNSFFFPKETNNQEVLDSLGFTSVGIFQDIYFFPWWCDKKEYQQSVQKLKYNFDIHLWRKVKGDGNCYFRAVLINYIELLIVNSYEQHDTRIFFSLIKDIVLTEFPKDKIKNKKLLLNVLLTINENLENAIYKQININSVTANSIYVADANPISSSFDILYRVFNKSDIIEKSLILWMRNKLASFLKANLDLEINGLKLVQLIPGFELEDDLSYDKNAVYRYIDTDLARMNEFVEGFPLYVTPLIFKVEINIFHINSNFNPVLFDMKYYKDISTSITPTRNYLFDLTASDYDNEINLLFTIPHYDTIYKHKFAFKINQLYPSREAFLNEGQMNMQEYSKFKSDLINGINTMKLNNNPLAQLLNNNNNNNSIKENKNVDDFNMVDLGKDKYSEINNINKYEKNRNSENIENFENANLNQNFENNSHYYANFNQTNENKENNYQSSENVKNASNSKYSENTFCQICRKEFKFVIKYPCQHSFCFSCFETYFNKILNFKRKKHDIEEFNCIEDIINTLKKELLFKYAKCLMSKGCSVIIPFDDLELVLHKYFQLRDYNNGNENNIEANNINNKNNNKKYCKDCQSYCTFISLSDNCNVCIICQKESIRKENGSEDPRVMGKKKFKPNMCCKCMQSVLFDTDYDRIFKR